MAGSPASSDKTNENEELLVVAMTRPAMIAGMSLTGVVMSVYLPVMLILITKQIMLAFLLIPCFIFTYMVSLKDVYLFNIGTVYMPLWTTGRNGSKWGHKSYEPK